MAPQWLHLRRLRRGRRLGKRRKRQARRTRPWTAAAAPELTQAEVVGLAGERMLSWPDLPVAQAALVAWL